VLLWIDFRPAEHVGSEAKSGADTAILADLCSARRVPVALSLGQCTRWAAPKRILIWIAYTTSVYNRIEIPCFTMVTMEHDMSCLILQVFFGVGAELTEGVATVAHASGRLGMRKARQACPRSSATRSRPFCLAS